MRSRSSFVFLMLFLSLAFTIYQAGTASANPDGKNGYSGNPATNGGAICNSCHFGGATPTVSLTGPNTVDTGSTHTYTLIITGGQEIAGGFDVSATNGTLAAIETGTAIDTGEVVHSTPRAASGATVSWTFNWTAPAIETTVTMYGAGNSVNGNFSPDGDQANKASLIIAVNAPPPVNQPPVADAGGPYNGTAGDPVQFDGSGSTDADGSIVSYDWDFGDGSNGTGANPTHAYAAAGSYVVSLTVTDDSALTDSRQTSAEIFSGPTPSISRVRTPRKVGVTSRRSPTKTIAVSATVEGVPIGETLCGTAFLHKNTAAYLDQPICVTAGSRSTVKFQHTFSADDSPSVDWGTYVVVGGAESQYVTKTTDVNVR